jgi:uncharacterized membrane protein YccF (DUF307 family)
MGRETVQLIRWGMRSWGKPATLFNALSRRIQMSLIGNIIWLIFGGFMGGLGYIIGGLSTCMTIIGIPFGIETIKVGVATFTPFGKAVIEGPNVGTPLVQILNIIWFFLFGWAIALNHLFWGALLAVTVIGLPFAKQHFKLMVLAIMPFGRSLETVQGQAA